MKPKYLLLLIPLGLVLSGVGFAAETDSAKISQVFDDIKIVTDKDYILHDFIEFSIFDMAEMKIVNDTPLAPELIPPAPPPVLAPKKKGKKVKIASIKEDAKKIELPPSTIGEKEIRDNLTILPKYFYKSLKQAILSNKIPVTLYPKDAPGFSKPIVLYIKVKSLHFAPEAKDKTGQNIQPFTLRIYGQIKDKQADQVLMKFYDSVTLEFSTGTGQAQPTLANASVKLMQDLAQYLKSKY